MFPLDIKSEMSQFVSLFFFVTIFLGFGTGIISVFVAEDRLFLALDWNFLIIFFVTGDEYWTFQNDQGYAIYQSRACPCMHTHKQQHSSSSGWQSCLPLI